MPDSATPHGTIRRLNTDDAIQRVSDTALLAAGWRAMESSRSDALFDDPLAAGLAGEWGLRIAATLQTGHGSWPSERS
jgi:O-Methyltransferase involved in polyketide biosynthesis